MNGTLRIIYVEDSREDRELVAEALRREGFHCEFLHAATEEEFRQALGAFNCDVILSDFTLPAFSGPEALSIAKTLRPAVPFLFVSGTIGEERAVESLKRGATDCVLKTHLDRLGPALRRALNEARERAERLRAEQLLRASEERFRQVVENIHEVFWLADLHRKAILYVSPAYEKIWGRTCESLYHSSHGWLDAIHPEDRQRVIDAASTKQHRGEYNEVYRIIRPDGSLRWIHDRAFPLREPDGWVHRVAGIAEDITRQRTLEEQFRHVQKMESIGKLAGGVAHDFNNILTVIQGHASLLSLEPNLTETGRDAVRVISLASERAASLTRQLLTFSRRQVINTCMLNLNQVIESTITMLRRVLGEDVALQFSPGEVPPVLADAGMLEQVLMNLAVNARDAMPDGGSLDIQTGMEVLTESFVAQNPEAAVGRFLWLKVADTGCGIPPGNLPNIFEPFFTTKDVGKGTGLGLATVYGIVKQHHGWISLESEVDRGTTFKIYLPAATGAVGVVSGTSDDERVPGGTETILVVEDEPVVNELVSNILESYGYRILRADSAAAALQQWEQHNAQTAIHLLLTDLVMPGGVNGRELAELLRAKNPALKVIYTSGYAAEVVGKDLRLQNGINFLQKPYDPRALAKCVRACLDRPAGNS